MIYDGKNKLGKDFYAQNAVETARKLPGKIFVRRTFNGILAGRIVECEAYDGSLDQAAHSFRGKTPRNEVMFGEGGHLYVYFTYGMHYCCNVVTGQAGHGQGVLIRALEPLEGLDEMALNRFGKKEITHREKINLTSGPAKICSAYGIDRKSNGEDLLGDKIFLLDGELRKEEKVTASERVGITRSTELEWRFYIEGNPWVSRK